MMNAAKVYKKTKVVQTPLALVQIESEYYEERPAAVVLAEGPPKWLKKTDPSQPHPDAKRQTDQRHHMNVLFQLGQQHQTDSGEEKSTSSCDKRESVGAHRAASARHLEVSDDSSSSNNKEAPPPQREVVEKNAAETYLGISLRDISNKLFMTSMDTKNKKQDRSGGVEETKEGDERDSMPSMAGFDIGKVLPMNLLDSIPTMPFITAKTEQEAELNDPAANGAAPLFTKEMQAKQQQSLVPLAEIRIMNPCDACNANLLTVDDSGCYLRPAQSDDMSCVTIDNNLNPVS